MAFYILGSEPRFFCSPLGVFFPKSHPPILFFSFLSPSFSPHISNFFLVMSSSRFPRWVTTTWGACGLSLGFIEIGFMVYGLWFMPYDLWFMVYSYALYDTGLGLRSIDLVLL